MCPLAAFLSFYSRKYCLCISTQCFCYFISIFQEARFCTSLIFLNLSSSHIHLLSLILSLFLLFIYIQIFVTLFSIFFSFVWFYYYYHNIHEITKQHYVLLPVFLLTFFPIFKIHTNSNIYILFSSYSHLSEKNLSSGTFLFP